MILHHKTGMLILGDKYSGLRYSFFTASDLILTFHGADKQTFLNVIHLSPNLRCLEFYLVAAGQKVIPGTAGRNLGCDATAVVWQGSNSPKNACCGLKKAKAAVIHSNISASEERCLKASQSLGVHVALLESQHFLQRTLPRGRRKSWWTWKVVWGQSI